MRLLKIKPSWKSVVFTIKVGKNSLYFVGVFNTTIIPLALVGYEMIIANLALRTSFAIYRLISNTHTWNNIVITHVATILIFVSLVAITKCSFDFILPYTYGWFSTTCILPMVRGSEFRTVKWIVVISFKASFRCFKVAKLIIKQTIIWLLLLWDIS